MRPELSHGILTHLDIFEHDLKLLGKLKTAFLLQLEDQELLCILKRDLRTASPNVEQALAEGDLIEALKDIFILEEAEYLDDTVQSLVDLSVLQALEILLELIVKVVYETHGGLLALLVDEVLE